jgi:hypothetical protein
MIERIITLLLLLLVFSCRNHEVINSDGEVACEYCISKEKITNLDKRRITCIALGWDLKHDSVKIIQDSLFEQVDSIVSKYQVKFDMIDFKVKDSLKALCYAHVPYGEGLNNEKVSRMMWYLGTEVLEMKSGHSLQEGAYLADLEYKVSEKGDTMISQRGVFTPIANFTAYRQGEIDAYNAWMIKINLYLKELTGMVYEEMSDQDILLLSFKLRYFMEEKMDMG